MSLGTLHMSKLMLGMCMEAEGEILPVQGHNTEPCHEELIPILILTERNSDRLIHTCYTLDITYITYTCDLL